VSTPVIVLAVVAAILVGYWAGRVRPLTVLDDWVWDHDPAPHTVGWWAREAYCAVGLACHPLKTWQALRDRRKPRPEPVQAPAYDPQWVGKRNP
jgi:hypothetical protein